MHSLGGGVNASFDIRRVSDDDYFRDFSSFGLNEASYTYLPSNAGLSWSGARYFNASLYAYTYQTLQDKRSEERRVGKGVSVRVDIGGRRVIKTKKQLKAYHGNNK